MNRVITYVQKSPINAHADVSSRAGLKFGLSLYLHPHFMHASSQCSCMSAQLHLRILACAYNMLSNKISCAGPSTVTYQSCISEQDWGCFDKMFAVNLSQAESLRSLFNNHSNLMLWLIVFHNVKLKMACSYGLSI